MGKVSNNGIILINKEKNLTSHDVLRRLKKFLPGQKIGHFGTLDPFATGLLVVGIGEGTKLSQFMIADDKEYIGIVKFGENRDTFDIDGKTTGVFDTSILKKDEVEKVILSFKGEYSQLPPIYSAVKVKGKPLYKYARAGVEISIDPRKVKIHNIEILNYVNCDSVVLKILCSKGTYIRSLAYDIGKKLNVGGFLKDLTRIRSGNFSIDNSHRIEEIANVQDKTKFIVPMNEIPVDFTTYFADELQEKYLRQGRTISLSKLRKINERSTDKIKIIGSGGLVSIGSILIDNNLNIKGPEKFFRSERIFNDF